VGAESAARVKVTRAGVAAKVCAPRVTAQVIASPQVIAPVRAQSPPT